MAFVIDDVALEAAAEATKEVVKEVVSESAKDIGEVATDSVAQNPFNPSDFLNTNSRIDVSQPKLDEIANPSSSELCQEQFAPDEFNESNCIQEPNLNTVEQSSLSIERTSTFEEQTIDNTTLEAKRPEIQDKLNLGKEHDGEVLRENLGVATGQNPENSNAHHIVGNDTPRAAEILEKYGIDRNDPANGIFLPDSPESQLKGSIHGQGRHCKEYSNEVEQRFAGVSSREEALEVLDSLKEDLYSGNLPLHNDVQPNR